MTKLFEKVIANDYEWLEQLIQSKKKVDWNAIKHRFSIIYKAIEFRSLQCFDLLIEIPELDVFSNTSGNINGLSKALDYYAEAPNQINFHYINKLFEKNVNIGAIHYSYVIKNQMIFDIFFHKMEKTENNMNNIIYNIIRSQNLHMLMQVYDYMGNNNLHFYQPNNMILYNTKIFKSAFMNFSINNIPIIEFYINKGVVWKLVDEEPTLYYIFRHMPQLFNYFYKLHETLSKEEINSIANIKDISHIIKYLNVKSHENFKQILLLPIDFNDMKNAVIKNVQTLYQPNIYYYSSPNFDTLYLLLYCGKVLSNPYDDFITKIAPNKNIVSSHHINIRKIYNMISHFGWKIPEPLQEFYSILFTDKTINYEKEKDDFIAEYTKKFEPKVSKKKTTKKAIVV